MRDLLITNIQQSAQKFLRGGDVENKHDDDKDDDGEDNDSKDDDGDYYDSKGNNKNNGIVS